MLLPELEISLTMTRRSLWGYGRGCRRIRSTSEKIAVDAPMPSAIVVRTTAVNDGDFAYRESRS